MSEEASTDDAVTEKKPLVRIFGAPTAVATARMFRLVRNPPFPSGKRFNEDDRVAAYRSLVRTGLFHPTLHEWPSSKP